MRFGEAPGDENVVVCVDEIVSKYMGEGKRPLLRVAQHRARVQRDHQLHLLDRATACWDAVTSGHIFTDLSREDTIHDLLILLLFTANSLEHR